MTDYWFPREMPAARKEYTCEWCYSAIQAGENHMKWTGLVDGAFCSDRLHLDCTEVYDKAWIAAYSRGAMLQDEGLYCFGDARHPRGGFCPECNPDE